MQYVEVLPLVTTGGGDQVFTYETDVDVNVGSLVSIPLKNRFVRGMVTAFVKKPEFKTRPIKKVLSEESVLSETQLALAKKISEFYFCTLSDAISAILSFDFGKKRRVVTEKQKSETKLQESLNLTADQKKIFEGIKSSEPASKHLLFGVTGSGKTEVYLQLIEEGLAKGKGAIVLVPEISLTPQTLARFEKRFGDKVAVWHSGMKETEKYHTWQKIKSGEKMIVVGARSAIFSPISDLGYIIIDEEHESSYKQDQTPRYEATQVAEWLADLTGAKLILGTATPKIESFKKARDGIYHLWRMNKRIVQDSMPPVKIIDLRDEFKKGNKSIFSDQLEAAIKENLKEKRQIVLFVNRRGASTFISCRDCGYVSSCPACEVPLTYHPSEGQLLKCHHCGHKEQVPTICPTCGSYAIRYFGLGTQKVELETKKLFPRALVARMDRDTTGKRGSHEEIYNSFLNKECDILIGTQLIAKGWDLPNVGLVGVISADTTLNLPDFRASERTFSLLTQVSGRTGRGEHPGEVFIQTYSPDNYAIKAAAKHDYVNFFEKEITEREKYHYPPFSSLIKLNIAGASNERVETEATRTADCLAQKLGEKVDILGPAPAFIPKVANRYRWQIILKTKGKNTTEIINSIKTEIKKDWVIDVNPDNLL